MKDFKYRFNKFIIKTDRNNNDESVWYNSLTGAIVSIKDYEEDNIFTDRPCDYANYLLANYFLVPEDFNEDEARLIMDSQLVCHDFFTWNFEEWRPYTEEEIKKLKIKTKELEKR